MGINGVDQKSSSNCHELADVFVRRNFLSCQSPQLIRHSDLKDNILIVQGYRFVLLHVKRDQQSQDKREREREDVSEMPDSLSSGGP